MANTLYPLARQGFLEGNIPWLTGNFKMILVTSGYVYSAAHQFLSSVGGGNIVATSSNLSGKTSTLGTANCDPVTYLAVTGSTVTAVIVYQDTGVAATSPLIVYDDTATGSPGLPVVPNGGNITVTPDAGANKLFTL
jgi:hypothetical protein